MEIRLRQVVALLENRNIGVEIIEAAKNRLANLRYDPAFGARRPLGGEPGENRGKTGTFPT
jgi:ATP-dependent Clp protease ATP-binding subunit ClpA